MPALTEDEIKAKILDGSIFAISVDTNIFDRYGCNLDFKALQVLEQFKRKPTRVVFSDVVINEIKSHIARDAAETQRELKKAIKQNTKRWKHDYELNALPPAYAIDADPKAAADMQVDDYLLAIGAEVVQVTQCGDVSAEVLRRYFVVEPPFGHKEEKKHEFPDCFAVLSLEAFAAENEKLILCVSPDKGWQDFAKQSDYLVCIDDLEIALSYFNALGRDAVERTMAIWRAGHAIQLIESVEHAFEYRLDSTHFYAEADSYLDFEADPMSAVMQSIDLETVSEPIIIAVEDDVVTFSIELVALIGFEASFNFYAKDYIDRDYVNLGSTEKYVEEKFKFQLVIAVCREIDEEPDVLSVDVAERRIEVDFGDVEFFDGNPEHEKY